MKSSFGFKLILFFLASTVCLAFICYIFGTLSLPDIYDGASASASTLPKQYRTVIIDPGHGGEDGGASSASGLVEKDVNLDISLMLADMLRANGINVILTREDDRLLYDRNVDFHGRKKKLDLAARLTFMQKSEDAIFVSIHMNSYTDSRYSGLQVWYSQKDERSKALADKIQGNTRAYLQPENNRKTKAATSSIFLLHEAVCPAVLVECGFLSNAREAEKLSGYGYRRELAFVIFCSIIESLEAK